MERSTLPTKDRTSWVQSCGAGQAQVPRQSPGLGGPGGGQHRLMLSPLARSLALRVVLRIMGEVRAGTRADQWSPISPARASGDPPGAGRGCAPSPANPRRSFPAGQLDLALEECATTRSLPTLHPIAWPGRFLEEIEGFSSSFICFFPPRR